MPPGSGGANAVPKMTIRECVICGVSYRKTGTTLTCGVECRANYRSAFEAFKLRIQRKPRYFFACEVCGEASDSWSPRAKFCSADCKRVSLNTRVLAKTRAKRGIKTQIQCSECCVLFERKNGHVETCSIECKRARTNRLAVNRRLPAPPRTKSCKVCGAEFTAIRAQKMCSPACVEVNNRALARLHKRTERGVEDKRRYMRRRRLDPVYRRKKNQEKDILRGKKRIAYQALQDLGISCDKSTAYAALKELGIQI